MPETLWASAAFDGTYVSAIYTIPGFTTARVVPDWMHCCCIGILQYALGHTLFEVFIYLGGVESNKSKCEDVCSKILNMMRMMARFLDVDMPIGDLTVTMFKQQKKQPKFKLKAAEGRYILPIIRAMCAYCLDASSDHAKVRLQCLQALESCYVEMKQWSDASTRRIAVFSQRHLLLYAELTRAGWVFYPKHHLFAHCGLNCLNNPLEEWNYKDEGEIGIAVKSGKDCNTLHLSRSLLRRYRQTFNIGRA